jgi:hypothetical protein
MGQLKNEMLARHRNGETNGQTAARDLARYYALLVEGGVDVREELHLTKVERAALFEGIADARGKIDEFHITLSAARRRITDSDSIMRRVRQLSALAQAALIDAAERYYAANGEE